MPQCGDFALPLGDLASVTARAGADLASLKGADLLLTGCTGFIGKWLVETILHANEALGLGLSLTLLSRAPERFLADMPHLRGRDGLGFIKGDMANADLEGSRFTHAIHGVNLPFDGRPDWAACAMDLAALGTRNLMLAAARSGCRGVMLLSSGAAYLSALAPATADGSVAFKEAEVDVEETLAEPCVYGLAKRFTEAYAMALGQVHGLRVTAARLFAFVGPYMPLGRRDAICNFMSSALRGEAITVKGDGTDVRSYMYAADMAVWLLAVLARGRHGAPYNVGSDEAVTIAATAEAVSRAFPGKRPEVRILGQPIRGNAPRRYVPDVSRCKTELGLTREDNLASSCAKTAKWLLGNEQVNAPA